MDSSKLAIVDSESNTVAAQAAVFATYELLESIILALPASDILFAAKVCKTWSSVIAISSPIGQLIQDGMKPYMNFWYRPSSAEGEYAESFLIWGKVIVRRLHDVEAIVILPLDSRTAHCSLTRPIIGGEGKEAVKVVWDGKRKGWELKFRDETTGELEGGFVSNYTNGSLAKYLAKHYGGYCTGLKVCKPLCMAGVQIM